ncbi:DUF3575 domain-containing protein [Porphyromonadaceae bacterium W3.11]|nr:DUF3575 domain-containing protein [Porphyromonadaceae bacterium W3.11]
MEKNYIFRLILLFGLTLGYISSLEAQEQSEGFYAPEMKKHEVKVNALSTILLQHPEVAYEYSFNQDLSVGGRLGFSFNNEIEYLGAFQLMPYVRWHFYTGSNKNVHSLRGFFAEVNTAYTLYKINELEPSVDSNYTLNEVTRKNKSGFGMGVGVGYKYISRRNWVVETSLMAGRNFSGPDSRIIYLGLGLSIGKRF